MSGHGFPESGPYCRPPAGGGGGRDSGLLSAKGIEKSAILSFVAAVPPGNGEAIIRQRQRWAIPHPLFIDQQKRMNRYNFRRNIRQHLTWSNGRYGLLMILLLLLLVSPSAKSLMIQGMMKIGFFSPDLEGPVETPERMPDAVFKNAAGERLRLTDLKGKVVFINFWATWCPPCRAEMPTIAKLYGSFKANKDIVFLIVDADDSLKKAQAYLAENNLALPVYVPEGNIPYLYFSGALPTTVIIDQAGKMAFRHTGAADYSDPKMTAFIKKLIVGGG